MFIVVSAENNTLSSIHHPSSEIQSSANKSEGVHFTQEEEPTSTSRVDIEEKFDCYENLTIYYPIFQEAKFWIEGVLLIG